MTIAEDKNAARIDRRIQNHEMAVRQLTGDFLRAFRSGGIVSTPGWNKPKAPVVDVLSDMFADKGGDEALHELCLLLSAAARGEAVTMRAIEWISDRAGVHAAFHADDLAEQMES